MAAHRVDVVVVGGGPAGVSTALHLQRIAPHPAARVVVLEKDVYPREKTCAGALGARALRALESLGIEIDVPRTPLNVIRINVGGQQVEITVPSLGVVVRRVEFDHALARRAAARGIEIRDGCAVERVVVGQREVRIETASSDVFLASSGRWKPGGWQ